MVIELCYYMMIKCPFVNENQVLNIVLEIILLLLLFLLFVSYMDFLDSGNIIFMSSSLYMS